MVSVTKGKNIAGSAKLLEATIATLVPVVLYKNTTPICKNKINTKSGIKPQKPTMSLTHSLFESACQIDIIKLIRTIHIAEINKYKKDVIKNFPISSIKFLTRFFPCIYWKDSPLAIPAIYVVIESQLDDGVKEMRPFLS